MNFSQFLQCIQILNLETIPVCFSGIRAVVPRRLTRKSKKEIEMETTGSDFLPLCRYDKSPKTFDEKLSLALKRIDELIERNKKSSQKMIADDFSPRNPVSTDPQKMGCEEALIEESSMSTDSDESHQFVEAGAVLDFQVSLEFGTSEFHKQYTVYSSYELNEKRDRGLCIWCDEFWYIGHDCCKNKKCYVLDIDVDDTLEGNECTVSETLVNVELVEEQVVDFDENLTGQGIQTDSILVQQLPSKNEIKGEGMNGIGDNDRKAENVELKVFEELLEKDALESFDEIFVTYPTDVESNRLWTLAATIGYLVVFTAPKVVCLDDVCSGKWMSILIWNQPSKGVDPLHKLYGLLEDQTLVVEWPELSLPPPEPPPRMI